MSTDQEAPRTEHDIGEIFRRWGPAYSRTHLMTGQQRKVMQALGMCRTAQLGGHLEKCDRCGYERPVYNSCGNRHCPKCQGIRMRKWLAARRRELLPVPYFHCIFTLPHTFNALVPHNARLFYDLLFRAASETLKQLACEELGGQPAIVAVLHTWGQALWLHPHVHCIVTGGALSADRRRWAPTTTQYLFDITKMSEQFRDRFCALLGRARLRFCPETAHLAGTEAFHTLLAAEAERPWVVHCKPGPARPEQVPEYIGLYTHRVAIANGRIRSVTDAGMVTFTWKDNRDKDEQGRPRRKTMSLSATQFIGRFLLHVLPRGFRKVRFYGLLAGRDKQAKLEACRGLLGSLSLSGDGSEPQPVDQRIA